jgi:hypothetical protein
MVTHMTEPETRQTIRLPDTLLTRLRAAAERNRRSVHAQMLIFIERGLDADEGKRTRGPR